MGVGHNWARHFEGWWNGTALMMGLDKRSDGARMCSLECVLLGGEFNKQHTILSILHARQSLKTSPIEGSKG